MSEHARMLDLIERTVDLDPTCPACGAPTTVAERGGHLFLVCTAAKAADGLAARIEAAFTPHVRREIVDLAEALAA
jgi:hypothetical protein